MVNAYFLGAEAGSGCGWYASIAALARHNAIEVVANDVRIGRCGHAIAHAHCDEVGIGATWVFGRHAPSTVVLVQGACACGVAVVVHEVAQRIARAHRGTIVARRETCAIRQ